MSALVIVDSGCANVGSVRYALERLGASPVVSQNPATIAAAERVILPGVGAARAAMASLERCGLVATLTSLRQPVLGICLGMQLLFDGSEEGDVPCLGVVPGRCRRLQSGAGIRIPHMGWSPLQQLRDSPLTRNVVDGAYTYFVHSYAIDVSAATLMAAVHGSAFAALIQYENYFGAQFHPERSAAPGAQILANFLEVT